ncbi:MAG: hypothetical protein ACRDPA_26995, partial [Solirubrobacteraceae bacterium]
MSALANGKDVQERLELLERRLEATIRVVNDSGTRLDVLEGARMQPQARTRAPRPVTIPASSEPRRAEPEAPIAEDPATEETALSDFLGGRALAWLGGLATLLGIVLLLGLAISHDWIDPAVRVILAGAGSAALLAG